jgi:hypothetical protein
LFSLIGFYYVLLHFHNSVAARVSVIFNFTR